MTTKVVAGMDLEKLEAFRTEPSDLAYAASALTVAELHERVGAAGLLDLVGELSGSPAARVCRNLNCFSLR